MPPAYAPLSDFIAPARLRPQVWRLIVGLVVVIVCYLLVFAVGGALVYLRYGAVIAYGIVSAMTQGTTPGAVLILLFSFVGMAAGAIAAARLLHDRTGGTLFGGPVHRLVRDFVRVGLAVGAVNLIVAAMSVLSGDAVPGADLSVLWRYYPFAVAGLLLQITAEEILFRGYVMQQLAARYRARAIWMGIPALMFAAGHYAPETYGPAGSWVVVVWAGLFGILAADLTARTGTLGAAMGFHFATNAMALFAVGMEGNLDGMALWTVAVDPADTGAISATVGIDFLILLTGWVGARLVLRV